MRITQISKRTKLSRTTIYKYLALDFEEAIQEFDLTSRKKKLDEYQDWIVNWLREYPTLSGAQIYDWLQEKFPDINVGTIQKNVEGKDVRLYFIAFVLANSPHKYKWWLNRPFTTEDTIRCHEQAFAFYGGVAEEIVYDQDNLIAVSENAGDLILTSAFQQYIRQRKFAFIYVGKPTLNLKRKSRECREIRKEQFREKSCLFEFRGLEYQRMEMA